MVSQPPPAEVGLVFESLEASSRVAQLKAEIAQLKDALARGQQIGVAIGLLTQRVAHHPERAWSLPVRSPKNGHVKVRSIARAIIKAHCGRLSPAEVEILSVIEMHCSTAYA
jgi:hypothetical protein